ncbi:ATP-binding protein [Streptomyces microflavus]|uniref:ATP-binding protein n=1 Tax=Streptomyces TaxID=1883 RepID=UPI0004CD3234|nr:MULTISPECIES: ATP-binding protein [Streptomyces]WTF70538.1 ATP-binding protein [Streptomyces microflavus]
MSIWWSLHLRREAASVPLARRFLLGTMETAGVDPDISFDLSVALSEACANAVEHGGDRSGLGEYGDCGAERSPADSGQYRVTAYLDGEKCRIEVADSGPGFPARRALRPAAHTEHAEHIDRAQDIERAEHIERAQHPEPVGAQPAFAAYIPCVAESGRGLDLIEQLADHVQFGNRPGRGAVVSFDKVLKWREGALLMV